MSARSLVYGSGINDAGYVTVILEYLKDDSGKTIRRRVWSCPFYDRWKDLMTRCYSEKFRAPRPAYHEATCCEEWNTFSKFKAWMAEQDWFGKELDKDILIKGNTHYSPETCGFVSKATNMLVSGCLVQKTGELMGVTHRPKTGNYQARCKNGIARSQYLGTYSTAEEAHEAWRAEKHAKALAMADEQSDPRIAAALRIRFLNTTSTEGKDHE